MLAFRAWVMEYILSHPPLCMSMSWPQYLHSICQQHMLTYACLYILGRANPPGRRRRGERRGPMSSSFPMLRAPPCRTKYMHIALHVCMYVYVCTCMYVHIHTYTNTYVNTYTHTQMAIQSKLVVVLQGRVHSSSYVQNRLHPGAVYPWGPHLAMWRAAGAPRGRPWGGTKLQEA